MASTSTAASTTTTGARAGRHRSVRDPPPARHHCPAAWPWSTTAAIGALPRQAGAHATTTLASAFGITFWAAAALIAAAAAPALLLPRPAHPEHTALAQPGAQAKTTTERTQ